MTDELYDNETLWKLYSPKPIPWFSSKIVYEGWGIATFEKPAGTIEGKTKIVVNETGNLDIEMEYEKLNTNVTTFGTLDIKVAKFVQGNIGNKDHENVVYYGTGNVNPCSKLTVQTTTGTFTSDGKVFCFEGLGLDTILRFSIWEGTYIEKTAGNPKYWVLPLTNFISSFHLLYHPLITQHPLRLYSTPVVPEIADENQTKMALFAANRANTLISFIFDEKVGYIQPVLDYRDKEEKLKSGQAKKCITALMISEVTKQLDKTWFPYDYTNLISLAAGVNVGASWIEYRDDNGKLVSRKHIAQFENDYKKGYAVIDEGIHAGLGHLLSVASKSPEFGTSYFRVLISHLVRVQSYNRQIEDHMDLLCRAFDTLCEEFGLSVQNLINYLPQGHQTKINSILSDAMEEVRKLSNQSSSDLQPVLQQIESRIGNTKNIERAFGLAVIDLLKKYKMPDLAIMDKYYAQQPDSQGKSWAKTLTKYRGAVIHTGYFSNGKYDIHDVLILEDHLQDILIRIALKILGFEGNYQPRVIQYLVDEKTVNWVNEDTSASELGYKALII